MQTNLNNANLDNADLRESNLGATELTKTNLNNANLSGAVLAAAVFNNAILTDVDFSNVMLFETYFTNVDLSAARNLEMCYHAGPSNIDHRSLAKSGKIPDLFLRNCGLPEHFIRQIPSLFSKSEHSCFVSYSSKDKEFVERLCSDLKQNSVSCFFAPEDMPIGSRIRRNIDENIYRHEKFLLILSENSIVSDWVEHEVETALAKENEQTQKSIILLPIRLDNAVYESKIGWAAKIQRERHIGNFCRWKEHNLYKRAFDRLIGDLKASGK